MFVPEFRPSFGQITLYGVVLVPHGQQVEVELRNASGSAFLRKTALTRQAALNQAEYLRLLLRAADLTATNGRLKPFALVIEDDRGNSEALSDAMRIAGMRALACRNGLDGVALARELSPDLVVVEHPLPDGNGAEVCRRLREDQVTARTPIIAVTASPEALRAEGCPADAVLTKPCQIDTLIAAARLFVRHLSTPPDVGL